MLMLFMPACNEETLIRANTLRAMDRVRDVSAVRSAVGTRG
jgi:hypothetical protein